MSEARWADRRSKFWRMFALLAAAAERARLIR